MSDYYVLTQKNFVLYCAKNYQNGHCTGIDEFNEDLRRIKYLKKLLTRYEQNGELKTRLILNHIIILNNCFGPEVLCKIMFLKMRTFLKHLKPFLIYLNLLPPMLYNIETQGAVIYTDDIPLDQRIVDELRKI